MATADGLTAFAGICDGWAGSWAGAGAIAAALGLPAGNALDAAFGGGWATGFGVSVRVLQELVSAMAETDRTRMAAPIATDMSVRAMAKCDAAWRMEILI
ncbi:MAG: hypothetical protein C0511_13050 [Hyphomicrobium sp.]|nr:hypothetical protein [Hyphomicrobium sp.]